MLSTFVDPPTDVIDRGERFRGVCRGGATCPRGLHIEEAGAGGLAFGCGVVQRYVAIGNASDNAEPESRAPRQGDSSSG
jgi:hypothetical protein